MANSFTQSGYDLTFDDQYLVQFGREIPVSVTLSDDTFSGYTLSLNFAVNGMNRTPVARVELTKQSDGTYAGAIGKAGLLRDGNIGVALAGTLDGVTITSRATWVRIDASVDPDAASMDDPASLNDIVVAALEDEEILSSLVSTAITAGVGVDTTLSVSGMAADAAATGERCDALESLWYSWYSQSGNWYAARDAIRRGLGEQVFPLGTTITVQHSTYGAIEFEPIAYDHHLDPTGKYSYSVTFWAYKSDLPEIQFDEGEALYYCADGLSAGAYYITGMGGSGNSRYFTLTKDVPAGGCLKIGSNTGTSVTSYESVYTSAYIETVSSTSGSSGTLLGDAYTPTENMNYYTRSVNGSNNWAQSCIRQWLNSDGAAGEWWEPQTTFDRAPDNRATVEGFMKGLPSDFLSVVGKITVTNATNTVFETDYDTGSSYETTDKFWLLSYTEFTGNALNGIYEGSQIDQISSSANRIRYASDGTAKAHNIRGGLSTGANTARIITTAGSTSTASANGARVPFPAFTIY